MRITDVWVVTCQPNEEGLEPYTYGVFSHEDYAIAHSELHGSKNSKFLTRKESFMEISRDDLSSIEREIEASRK